MRLVQSSVSTLTLNGPAVIQFRVILDRIASPSVYMQGIYLSIVGGSLAFSIFLTVGKIGDQPCPPLAFRPPPVIFDGSGL
jgi:hypothetical protein